MDEIPGYSPSTFYQVSYLLYCQCLNYSFFWCLQLRRKRKKLHYWEHLLAPIIKEKVSDCAFPNKCNSS